jgi:hypothetical protein
MHTYDRLTANGGNPMRMKQTKSIPTKERMFKEYKEGGWQLLAVKKISQGIIVTWSSDDDEDYDVPSLRHTKFEFEVLETSTYPTEQDLLDWRKNERWAFITCEEVMHHKFLTFVWREQYTA